MFKSFRYFISYIFSMKFLFISCYKTKKSTISPENLKNVKEERYTYQIANSLMINEINELKWKNAKKHKIKSTLFLVCLCINGLFCYLFRLKFEKKEYIFAKQSIGNHFNIGFYILFSYVILKQKLYKHNYVSSGIIAAILLILFIISIIVKVERILNSFFYYFFYSLFFSLYDVLKKKYMNYSLHLLILWWLQLGQ